MLGQLQDAEGPYNTTSSLFLTDDSSSKAQKDKGEEEESMRFKCSKKSKDLLEITPSGCCQRL